MLSRRRYPSDLTDEQWERIKRYFRQWRKIQTALTAEERERQGRPPKPSAVIIDSQRVKTTEKGAKAMMQRKRSKGGSNL